MFRDKLADLTGLFTGLVVAVLLVAIRVCATGM